MIRYILINVDRKGKTSFFDKKAFVTKKEAIDTLINKYWNDFLYEFDEEEYEKRTKTIRERLMYDGCYSDSEDVTHLIEIEV